MRDHLNAKTQRIAKDAKVLWTLDLKLKHRHIPSGWRPVAGLSLILAWCLCWVTLVAAQAAFPTLNGVVADDTGQVDADKVNAAAADLQKMSPAVKPLAVLVSGRVGADQITVPLMLQL